MLAPMTVAVAIVTMRMTVSMALALSSRDHLRNVVLTDKLVRIDKVFKVKLAQPVALLVLDHAEERALEEVGAVTDDASTAGSEKNHIHRTSDKEIEQSKKSGHKTKARTKKQVLPKIPFEGKMICEPG